jgi:hypothetical protein
VAAGGAGLIGNWKGMARKFTALSGPAVSTEFIEAPKREAVRLVIEIKKGIVSQSPGGQQFQRLAQSTIDRKGSSQALIDTSSMISAITFKVLENGAIFIGLLRTQAHKAKKGSGEAIKMANIGAIHEFGVAGDMPDQNPLGDTFLGGNRNMRIPARPFIGPVWAKEKAAIMGRIGSSVRKALKGIGL